MDWGSGDEPQLVVEESTWTAGVGCNSKRRWMTKGEKCSTGVASLLHPFFGPKGPHMVVDDCLCLLRGSHCMHDSVCPGPYMQ